MKGHVVMYQSTQYWTTFLNSSSAIAVAVMVAAAGCGVESESDDSSGDLLDLSETMEEDDALGSDEEALSSGHYNAKAAYRVTITNLSEKQWLTPPVVALHRPYVALFRAGYRAPNGVRELAENGNNAPLVEALDKSRAVADFAVGVSGDPPPLMPGESVTVELEARPWRNRLSIATMLICSNDGFTGVDSVRLPVAVGRTRIYYTRAYDAGSEINTEDFADIVPPCQPLSGVFSDDDGTGQSNPALAENSVVAPHRGIDGTLPTSDLTVAAHGFDNPIAVVEVTRIARYDVTIENPTSGQPLTPPVVATHRRSLRLFASGDEASVGIQQVAENGNLAPLVEALRADSRVSDVVVAAGDPPPVLPGASISFRISSDLQRGRISFASMLICTNDGFTGVNQLRLPRAIGRTVSRDGVAYDAGTEINTEDFADIVPPCQALSGVSSPDAGTGMSNPDLAENALISPHPGIDGSLASSDLTLADHAWDTSAPTSRISVTRTH
ncbi:MAG: spondin domain-containing protein [Proteobacteria bacterium]|nr:spondin domain-containing protein [Pseudomonadota bacterium]